MTVGVGGGPSSLYDPALGQFLSPDTLVPDAGLVLDDGRYMYVRGNPLKYTDPSGHYSDPVLFEHFNCSDWACINRYFEDGGSHAGLWGWLTILLGAVDGNDVRVLKDGITAQGRFATVDGKIVVQNGTISMHDEKWKQVGHQPLGPNIPESAFASLAYLGSHERADYYSPSVGVVSYTEQQVNCRDTDCTARTLNALSMTAASAAAGCAYFGQIQCTGVAQVAGWTLGFASTAWTTYKAFQGEATTVDVAMSVGTASGGALGHPYIGPVYSGIQWFYDESISPYLGR